MSMKKWNGISDDVKMWRSLLSFKKILKDKILEL